MDGVARLLLGERPEGPGAGQGRGAEAVAAGWGDRQGDQLLTFEKEVEQHPKDVNLVLNWPQGQGDRMQVPGHRARGGGISDTD